MPDTSQALSPVLTPGEPGPAAPTGRGHQRLTSLATLAAGLALTAAGLVQGGGLGIVAALIGLAATIGTALALAKPTARSEGRIGYWLGLSWLGVLTATALLANLLPLPEGRDPSLTLDVAPLIPPDLFSDHPVGTDTQGLDVLSQLVYGARVSLVVAVGGVLVGILVGGALGMVAGYLRGFTDAAIGFVTDVVLAFPALILLLALVTVLDPSVLNVTLALGLLSIPGYVRLARANTLKVASRDFVTASRTLGAGRTRILVREVLPNVAPSLMAYSFIVVGYLIVAEASLSFLGVGIQRPNPTWGNLIAQGTPLVDSSPFVVFAPATVLFITVLAMNHVGGRLQARWGL